MTSGGPGPRSKALAARLAAVESPNITFWGEDFPVYWASARGCTVTDVDGQRYLDATGAFGVAAIGHNHPAVVGAVRAQARCLLHGMGDVHPSEPKVDLCERLSECAPVPDGRVILTGGGAEAVEAALKTAALATHKPGVIAFEGAYHGLSYGALAVTHRPDFRLPWLGQLGHHSAFVPFPENSDEACAALDALDERFHEGTPAGAIGAVIIEPIQGRAGVRVPPPGFLAHVAETTRRHGALLITDEIFSGLGRTGRLWASDHDALVPDILVCGKALGGGLPIGACIGSAAAMAAWPASDGEALHTSTFLGNPLVCAAALAALEILRQPETAALVRLRGAALAKGLRDLCARHPHATHVRGTGLFLGVQVSSADLCGRLVVEGLKQGLILLGGGLHRNVLTITPSYFITETEAAGLTTRLDATLAACTP